MYAQITTTAALNKYSAAYDLGNGVLCKAVIELLQQTRDAALMQRTAYQIDSSGNFVADSQGHPICTETIQFSINAATVQAQQATLNPGWVKGKPQQEVSAATLPAGWKSGAGAPQITGVPGDWYFDTDSSDTWTYDMGQLELHRQTACDELAATLNHGMLFT